MQTTNSSAIIPHAIAGASYSAAESARPTAWKRIPGGKAGVAP